TSDGSIEIAGFNQLADELTDFSDLTDFSALSPLLAPSGPRPARLPPASAFPPPPASFAAKEVAPARRAAAPARKASVQTRRPARVAQLARANPRPRRESVKAAPGKPAQVIVCKKPVVEGGRYRVDCE
ncbi:MAG: hypothetical protein H0T56_15015, partial [Pseudaminobacter sp.]|nr:hypothetical protein [Pseudaminobacter sp.]